ncbi:MAG: hypothetical protein IKO71_07230 [Bacteroidaceae bacterium]|nr:hypothetical protein [Bacteroidaceae bacterium]
MDSETGEALPYVTIVVGNRFSLLSNEDGNFTLTADSDEVIFFSRIGYEKLNLNAGRMGNEVRLRPMVKSLAEVTVLPFSKDDILKRCIENLESDYKKGKKKDRLYFSRTVLADEKGNEMLEAFIKSHSVVNLRSSHLVSGIVSQDRYKGGHVRSTNVHHLIEVGPKVYKSPFWETSLIPFNDWEKVRDSYEVSYSSLSSSDSSLIYKFDLKYTGRLPKKWKGHKSVVEGSLYIRSSDFRLLQFDGTVRHLYLRVRDPEDSYSMASLSKPATLETHIQYQYKNGYTEVANMSLQGESEDMKYRIVLFNVSDTIVGSKRSVRVGENMVKAITDAGIDSVLWANTGIIQRTESEECLAFGKPAELFMKSKHPSFVPDTTWTSNARLRAILDNLHRFGTGYPQEKVFLHTDNTCYFLGDTIWFATYTRQTSTDTPSKISKVLYVELYNNDGYLVERKMLEMNNGWSNGFFALTQPLMYSGFYELRAYTRWQLNWGVNEHKHSTLSHKWFLNKALERDYYKDYDKLYSRVFPVYDKPADPQNPERNMTSRIMRRYFSTDMDERERKMTLAFFPEGGNLVTGVENRVAFEAAMSDGEQLEGTLMVGNQEIPTVNRGRGMFTVVPTKGMEREVTFITKTGERVSAKLPKPEEQGVAIQVKREGDSIFIETNIAGLISDSLGMTVMHEGLVEDVRELAAFTPRGVLKVGDIPGIHQVTVFDTQGKVWADRLFFVAKAEQTKPTLSITGLKDEYKPYEKIDMDIKGEGKNDYVSLSVRDGYQADALFDNGNIMTEMLLASEIKGFIPDPGWYFEKDDEEHRQALDLLMMTQGWRRFEWKDMAIERNFDFTQPAEKKPIVQGVVYNTKDINAMRNEVVLKDFFNRESKATEDVMKATEKDPRDDNKKKTMLEQMEKKKDNDENEEKQTQEMDFDVYAKQSSAYMDEFRQKYNLNSNLKHEVKIQADFTPFDEGPRTYMLDTKTINGHFQIELPGFYGESELYLAASDSTKWKRGRRHTRVVLQNYTFMIPTDIESFVPEEFPEFYVKVSFPYPRFVKPYSYYQEHTNDLDAEDEFSNMQEDDNTRTLREVSVKERRRGGLRRYDQSQPAFIIDARELDNLVYDSGIMFADEVMARTLFGDFGLEWPYVGQIPGTSDKQSRIYTLYGIPPNSMHYKTDSGKEVPQDSIYSSKYIQTFGRGYRIPGDFEYRYTPDYLEKYVIYTDYCPRLEGSKRYQGSNLPETRIALFPYNDGHRRPIYRDRYFILPGFSYTARFYSPDYSKQTPPEPTDYRRTLYWNPSLKLDENGQARITFYNNSRTTQLSVEAEGQASDGTLLWSK